MADSQHPTPPLDDATAQEERAHNYQPEGRQSAGSHDTGLTADDSSGSGGTVGGQSLKGAAVSGPASGTVAGGSTSSGTGVSGGETGQVTL